MAKKYFTNDYSSLLPALEKSAANNSGTLPSHIVDKINEYVVLGMEGAKNTQKAYTSDLKKYLAWCDLNNQQSLPASVETIAAYAVEMAETCKWSTLIRQLATISKLHQLKGYDTPTEEKQFRVVMEGIKRAKGIRQKQAPAFEMPTLKRILKEMETDTKKGLRDKAIILLGFTGAFRRSELVELNLEDLKFSPEGLIVSMAKSKTNQYGANEEKAVYYSPDPILCPIRTLQRWIDTLGRLSGPLFVRVRRGDNLTDRRLTDETVNDLVQKYFGDEYSAHSLRASFVTIAKLNGSDDSEVKRQTKHKSSVMIERYTRLKDILLHNAAKNLGL